ncbi:NAD(P)-dependent oxidoreductase [Chloroflexota bacterium]
MSANKMVVISTLADSSQWDVFLKRKPDGWQISLINPDEGEEKMARELEDAQYLVTSNSGTIPANVVHGAKQLKLIQTMGMDVGHLPMKWALDNGILVANAGGANAISVAEHTLFLILACLRRLPKLDKSIREGKFRKNVENWDTGSHQFYDKTVGIIGFGNIGRRVAKLCHDFGASIIYSERVFVPYALRADSKAEPVSLDELLSKSDIVSLHIPSFLGNRGMIGWNELCKMKPSAYIINTSRGINIDEDALVRALNEKKIAGAGIDVWDPEPPSADNSLLKMLNVVATPHGAGTVVENWQPRCETAWHNLMLVSEDKEPVNRIIEF